MCDTEVVRTLVDGALGTIEELEAFGVKLEKKTENIWCLRDASAPCPGTIICGGMVGRLLMHSKMH